MSSVNGSGYFPAVGVLGSPALLGMLLVPALALGIDIVTLSSESDATLLEQLAVATSVGDLVPNPQVKTLESRGALFRPSSSLMDSVEKWNRINRKSDSLATGFSIMVARSPHGQASSWAPTQAISGDSPMTVTPPPRLSERIAVAAQNVALDLAMSSALVGVMDVEFFIDNGRAIPHILTLGPTVNALWSIEGARTSVFEQHLRAILDLPLGDPSLTSAYVFSAQFVGKGNMYRPYLHLMARSPGLKIHQYGSHGMKANGHVSAMGGNLLELEECVAHAIEFMNGIIDE